MGLDKLNTRWYKAGRMSKCSNKKGPRKFRAILLGVSILTTFIALLITNALIPSPTFAMLESGAKSGGSNKTTNGSNWCPQECDRVGYQIGYKKSCAKSQICEQHGCKRECVQKCDMMSNNNYAGCSCGDPGYGPGYHGCRTGLTCVANLAGQFHELNFTLANKYEQKIKEIKYPYNAVMEKITKINSKTVRHDVYFAVKETFPKGNKQYINSYTTGLMSNIGGVCRKP